MPKKLETPKFKSEEEEALWYASHQTLLLDRFESAAKDSALGRGTVARGQTPTTTIRLDPADIELAKTQAEQRGLRYQTYLKMLIHQALVSEKSGRPTSGARKR